MFYYGIGYMRAVRHLQCRTQITQDLQSCFRIRPIEREPIPFSSHLPKKSMEIRGHPTIKRLTK